MEEEKPLRILLKNYAPMFKDIPVSTPIKVGDLLIAEPFSEDFYFKKSLVLLTETEQEGALGFVINKHSEYVLSDLITDISLKLPVYVGGPVETNSLHYVHTFKDIEGALKINETLFWGGDFDAIKKRITEITDHKSQIQFFLGYSAWSPNQLEEELKYGYWAVYSEPFEAEILNSSMDFWFTVTSALDPKYKHWLNVPNNPRWN